MKEWNKFFALSNLLSMVPSILKELMGPNLREVSELSQEPNKYRQVFSLDLV
jgi:hypothetical protein